MIKVFIDGQAGTTGLQLKGKLVKHPEVDLLEIEESKRKDENERKRLMNSADVVFLCLPDAAAVEAVSLVTDPDTVVIDASTAHRTADGWAYGFAELTGYREKIASSKQISEVSIARWIPFSPQRSSISDRNSRCIIGSPPEKVTPPPPA